jgi:hypothetical protein
MVLTDDSTQEALRSKQKKKKGKKLSEKFQAGNESEALKFTRQSTDNYLYFNIFPET